MRAAIFADIPGWIVDRIADRMIAGIAGIEFRKGYYGCLEPDALVAMAEGADLVHYLNWDVGRHTAALLALHETTPVIISVRSHRYPPAFRAFTRDFNVHVLSEALEREFPGARVIPDAVDGAFSRRLRVGYAGKPGPYKGTDLIEQACVIAGADYCPAYDLPYEAMPAYYDSIDVFVCASEAEGFGTVALEAYARCKRVISTRVGYGYERRIPDIIWVERTVAAIASELIRMNPRQHLLPDWPTVCKQFDAYYHDLIVQ